MKKSTVLLSTGETETTEQYDNDDFSFGNSRRNTRHTAYKERMLGYGDPRMSFGVGDGGGGLSGEQELLTVEQAHTACRNLITLFTNVRDSNPKAPVEYIETRLQRIMDIDATLENWVGDKITEKMDYALKKMWVGIKRWDPKNIYGPTHLLEKQLKRSRTWSRGGFGFEETDVAGTALERIGTEVAHAVRGGRDFEDTTAPHAEAPQQTLYERLDTEIQGLYRSIAKTIDEQDDLDAEQRSRLKQQLKSKISVLASVLDDAADSEERSLLLIGYFVGLRDGIEKLRLRVEEVI